MNNLDHFLQRNKEFAVQQSAAGTLMPWLPRALPGVKAIIIGCADMRVDPAHILGTKPGEAVVLRNIGGRITPGLLEQLSLLGRIGEVAGEIPGGGGEFHFIVLQHTDCGITRLAGDPAMLAHYFQIQEGEVKKKAVTDPRAAVAARRRCSPRNSRVTGRRGLYQASCTTWQPDSLRSSYRQRRSVRRKELSPNNRKQIYLKISNRQQTPISSHNEDGNGEWLVATAVGARLRNCRRVLGYNAGS